MRNEMTMITRLASMILNGIKLLIFFNESENKPKCDCNIMEKWCTFNRLVDNDYFQIGNVFANNFAAFLI